MVSVFIVVSTSYLSANQKLQKHNAVLIVFDDLIDFSVTVNHSSNLEIVTDNPTNFDGDSSRCVRTNLQTGTLIYNYNNIAKFTIRFWGVDNESGYLKVYGSTNGVSYSVIELDSSRVQFGYRYSLDYSPSSALTDSTKFLKIEILGGNGDWKGQIGSVEISDKSPFRNSSATFYIDAQNGSDANNGLSPFEAWQSLSMVNSLKLLPGDSVLLKSGQEFFGNLEITAKGTTEKPITIGKYGGEMLPVINAAGFLAGIQISNSSNINISDIEITSDAGEPIQSEARTNRYGIYATADQAGEFANLFFDNLNIHHIFASEEVESDGQNPTSNLGMGFYIVMKSKEAQIKNVCIENCNISMTGHTGIKIFGSGNSEGTSYLDSVTIINNKLENIGGPGMVPGRCNHVVVRGNVVNYSGSAADPRMHNRGSGIWPWNSKNVLIEKNKFMHAFGKYDSCGAHIDFNCSNVVIQYNLSFDNAGGFVEILGNDQNCVYRYNVSINDGFRKKGVNGAGSDGHIFWISSYVGSGKTPIGASDCRIYNNTIYVAPHIKTGIKFAQSTKNNLIKNNILYIEGELNFENQGENNVFDNNIYFGKFPKMPFGAGAFFVDPQLVNPGDTLPDSYKLKENSPAIGTGTEINDLIEFDFWGDSVSTRKPVDRGADESDFIKSFVTVKSTSNEGGKIYPVGSVEVPKNIDLPFVIAPNKGYIIKNVFVDENSAGTDSVYIFSDLSTNHAIHVNFYAPADSVTDPQNNMEIVSSYSNMKTQTDNPENFSGDMGRSVRLNTDTGYILYNFKEITNFEVDFWGVNGDNSTIKVYTSGNGIDFTPLILKVIETINLNSRVKTKYTQMGILPEGINFLKFEISGGDAAWKAQIGSVDISWLGDERNSTSSYQIRGNKLKVYPNPATNKLYISEIEKHSKIEIVSINGRTIKSKLFRNYLDISALKPGVYFIKIKGFSPFKFLKN